MTVSSLNRRVLLERFVYSRGFLVTNTKRSLESVLPILSTWTVSVFGDYRVYCHPDTRYHMVSDGDYALLMVGHSYNPWKGVASEEDILVQVGREIKEGRGESYLDTVDELSGRFVLFLLQEDTLTVLHDCAGIQCVYYYRGGNEIFVSSHSGLIAEVNDIPMSQSIKDLVSSPFYSIGIRHLPGIKSPYEGVYLLTANTLLKSSPSGLKIERYFPREPLESIHLDDAVVTIAEILGTSVELLLTKSKLSVSLTAGVDSRVTLAATRNVANQISYFSYISNADEERDAYLAAELCRELHLDHYIYRVPAELEEEEDQALAEIIHRNTAGIRNPKEYAKSIYLARHFPSDTLEVKSTVSEIGRKFYCKKLGVTSMPAKLTPRMMSNLYKRNAFDRRLLKYTDEAFQEFISVTGFGCDFMNYEEDDMFYWEHRLSAWQSLVVQDSDYSRDTTMLFNNRKLQKLFLSVDVKYRLNDELHRRIAETLWPEAAALPIVTNTGSRALKARVRELAERLFFRLNRF